MALATSPVVVDKVWFDGLKAEHRAAISNVLDAIIERQWRETVEKDKALVEQMVQKGSQYRVVEPAEVEKLRAAFKVASTEFTKANADAMAAVERLNGTCSVN
jgi:TRAP-type C4-dicarboxylate transport system substrate-binding protein